MVWILDSFIINIVSKFKIMITFAKLVFAKKCYAIKSNTRDGHRGHTHGHHGRSDRLFWPAAMYFVETVWNLVDY